MPRAPVGARPPRAGDHPQQGRGRCHTWHVEAPFLPGLAARVPWDQRIPRVALGPALPGQSRWPHTCTESTRGGGTTGHFHRVLHSCRMSCTCWDKARHQLGTPRRGWAALTTRLLWGPDPPHTHRPHTHPQPRGGGPCCTQLLTSVGPPALTGGCPPSPDRHGRPAPHTLTAHTLSPLPAVGLSPTTDPSPPTHPCGVPSTDQ